MSGVVTAVRRLEGWVARLELLVISLAMATMLACVSIGVVDRTFALPVPDLSEIALIGMAVLAFIGGAYAVYSGGHISIDVMDMVASPVVRKVAGWGVDLSIVAFSAAILVYGGPFMAYVFSIGERTPELELPIAFPVGCLMAGAVLSIFHVVCRLLPGAGAIRTVKS